MDLIRVVKVADVAGADEAGFSTHVKFSARAECFAVNDTECEPLIETGKYLMRTFPDQIIRTVGAVAVHVDTKRAVAALKKKYVRETTALRQAIATSDAQIELFEMLSFYPARDEQVLIQQICGTLTPECGVPLDVGAVVGNAGTLLNIHDALQGIPITEKYLSVVGKAECLMIYRVPLGILLRKYIGSARPYLQDHIVIVGGPMARRVMTDPTEVDHLAVTKTTGNLIVLSDEHYLACRAALPLNWIKTQTKSICVRCRVCINPYPRYLVGHRIQPCLMMRNLSREELISDNDEYEKAFGQAANCRDYGMCEMLSCPMGLLPCKVDAYLKGRLREKGIQVPRNFSPKARGGSLYSKASTDRLMARLELSEYYHQHVGDSCAELFPEQVWISFWQHIGRPVVPVVQVGGTMQKGDLLAPAAQRLSANVHTSISGTITEINEDGVSVCRGRKA